MNVQLDRKLDTSDAASLTIQEMAQQSGLSEHTLRYYERIGLISAVARDGSSGHRRYSPATAASVESLACLRGTGMSIEGMREHLRLRQLGAAAAAEHKALFAAHEATLCREMEILQMRRTYIAGKVAYWEAVESGDTVKASEIAERNHALAREMAFAREKQ